jgi:LuxR family maltose regulon positive regulatory protein
MRTVLVAALVVEARLSVLRGDTQGRAAEILIRAIELADGEMQLPFLGAFSELHDLVQRHPTLLSAWPTAIDATQIGGPAQQKSVQIDPLTEKEQAVLRLLSTSLTTRDIAESLGLSVNTVKTHIAAIYRKLGSPRRRDAVLRARRLELL